MGAIDVTLGVPARFEQGLQSGVYERVGGVIRHTDSKQIAGWLREISKSTESVTSEILSLSSVAAVSSTLNLAISTMGFAVVLYRLNGIEKQLNIAQEALEAIGYKIDISFYANFRAALNLAMNAFMMTNSETRKISAMQAINRLLEAEHVYSKLADIEVDNGSQVANEYLSTLGLAYVAEVRCYLELEEIDTASRRLQEGIEMLRPKVNKHIITLLTSNPAAYLHPSLSEQVDLKRLTKVYQWLTPEIDENEVFESLRGDLFILAKEPKTWIETLPQAIRIPQKVETGFFDKATEQTRKITGMIPSISRGLPGHKINAPESSPEDPNLEIFRLLPGALDLMELMIETDNRMEMYRSEIDTIKKMGLNFQEWRQLRPPSTEKENGAKLMCISLSE